MSRIYRHPIKNRCKRVEFETVPTLGKAHTLTVYLPTFQLISPEQTFECLSSRSTEYGLEDTASWSKSLQ